MTQDELIAALTKKLHECGAEGIKQAFLFVETEESYDITLQTVGERLNKDDVTLIGALNTACFNLLQSDVD